MYIRGLVPRKIAELAESVPIGECSAPILSPSDAIYTAHTVLSESFISRYNAVYSYNFIDMSDQML